jgi:hypothetical protein
MPVLRTGQALLPTALIHMIHVGRGTYYFSSIIISLTSRKMGGVYHIVCNLNVDIVSSIRRTPRVHSGYAERLWLECNLGRMLDSGLHRDRSPRVAIVAITVKC